MSDVVYVNYVVGADRLAPLIPPGLELQRIGEAGDQAMLTFLNYRHGHLGPALLGRWRRLLPSPLQSNWRVYVRHPRTGALGVHFLSTAIDRTFHAIGARMMAEVRARRGDGPQGRTARYAGPPLGSIVNISSFSGLAAFAGTGTLHRLPAAHTRTHQECGLNSDAV
ncbi:DUF2071 domain-containing protein [Streptomyces sp. NPDC001315]|uniref:DUF2071 domain-containing protein n=1 Tax=Streptomyces sp. NPDC001315 TaxID=3364562 RepID=UPI00367D5E83